MEENDFFGFLSVIPLSGAADAAPPNRPLGEGCLSRASFPRHLIRGGGGGTRRAMAFV